MNLFCLILTGCMMFKTQNVHAFDKLLRFRMPMSTRTARKHQDLQMVSTVDKPRSMAEQVTSASLASAAVVAAAAVNAAVGMRQLSAPEVTNSFVFKDGASINRTGVVDEVGLPLVYDKNLIQEYWKKQGSALSQRWTEFLGYAVPYLTRVVTMLVSGGSAELKKNGASLAKDARIIFEKLGPTYIKMGQMMSVRPDVLPIEALEELKILQDSVKPFDSKTAIAQIESELGNSLGAFFAEISDEPVAAASLAQVYKARLLTGEYVAVKIQRPSVLETVSKDLYVLRRAAEVYQGLIDRFAPQQKTNYVALLNEWAVGFYTELDFLNEAANQQRLKDLMITEGVTGIYIPKIYPELCTRRVLVSEWIDGVKLSACSPDEIKAVIPDAQEAFLTQLLQVGFFHADPHPGNIMYMETVRGEAKLALIDFGLVAAVKQKDMDTMISAIIHLANKDYASLVDDFINLEVLPADCDRPKVIPLMDKALTPYVKGGGAQNYEEELKKIYGMDGSMSGTAGGFSAMTQDALTVLNDIPFSIPPYFALLGRAIVTLEGIALTGDPSYGIIMEAYPFVARKLLSEDRPEIQRALQEVLYAGNGDLSSTRLSVLLNSALGVVARKSSGSFVDFDSIPDGAVDLGTALKYLLSNNSASLRNILMEEAVTAGDILMRQAVRKSFTQVFNNLPRPPFFGSLLPRPENLQIPFLIPTSITGEAFKTAFATPVQVLEAAAPRLSREEELYAISLKDLAAQTIGDDAAVLVNGDAFINPTAAARFFLGIVSTGKVPLLNDPSILNVAQSSLATLSGASSVGSASMLDKRRESLDDVMGGISALSEEESAILRSTTTITLQKLTEKLVARLQPLVR